MTDSCTLYSKNTSNFGIAALCVIVKVQLVRILFFLLFTLSFTAVADSELPEGKGKDAVENTCTDCHSLQRITSQRLNEEGWNGIVREMIENGASINPDDVKVIVNYLAKNFGPDKKININKAPASEIASVLQLTPAEADAIVQYRTRNGSFKSLNELQKVNGLADKIEAKKALIEF
ncbi:MAG: helix-hairpin-helix domain-containing protein [Acidobacteriaceae bacterium]|nr:helix-hairpin-helix domain-containing protein [Acidobacteriaceae bacterium]